MRIYIVNISPQSIKNKINNLSSLFGEPEKTIRNEICSKEFGISIIEENTIKHIETTFKTEYDLIKGYKNCDLLVDKTIYTLIPLVSQFPVNYISSKYIELKFKINTKSKLALIVECFEETNKLNYSLELIPVNYYFNYDCEKFDLKDIFFEEEFNMFLSNLN
jgi:hypothetical protein